MSQESYRVEPTTLVALFPCPFDSMEATILAEIHGEHWQQLSTWRIDPVDEVGEDGILAVGEVTFEGDEHTTVQIVVEEPLEEIAQLAATSAEPITDTEIVMLKEHRAIWRLQVSASGSRARLAARRMAQVMATMIEAGTVAAFMPGILRLHSQRFIRKQTMDPSSPEGLANLFVGAWHDDEGWMRTRGLTAFGLPEIEASTKQGLNGAYFLLMDIAANMLFQMSPYPDMARLQVGPYEYTLVTGPMSAHEEDEDVPMNGMFGVQTATR